MSLASEPHDGGSNAGPQIHVGRTLTGYEGRVDEDAAIAYALATNEPNPVYLSGGAVPPLFTTAMVRGSFLDANRRNVEKGAIVGARGVVHGEHEVRCWRPVRPGERLRWSVTTESARQLPNGVTVTQRIDVVASDESRRITHRWSSFHVGASSKAAEPAHPSSVSEGAGARSLGQHTFDLSLDQGFRYAGVSADHVPHAMDSEAARAEGFAGKILQGLCTFSMCSGAVIKIAASGDPHRLRRISGRFSAPAYPRNRLVVSVHECDDHDATEVRTVAFSAAIGDMTVVKHGIAEIG